MKIVLCYIAVSNGAMTDDFVSRFVATYYEYPPGIDHETIIICQGGPPPNSTAVLFSGMKAGLWPHANTPGWDVSAYIDCARGPCADADIMLCLGESVYFHQEGWFKRLIEAWTKYGPGFYGPFSSNNVRGHLQTTAFCCHPKMLRDYPLAVQNRKDRLDFEHGERALWRRVASAGMPVRLVTWDGEWEPRMWRMPQNIHYRGDQSNCLMWCNHSDGYAKADSTRKMNWSRTYDQPFK